MHVINQNLDEHTHDSSIQVWNLTGELQIQYTITTYV